MQQDVAWNRFMETIELIQNDEIPESYKKQFKTKDDFIFPRDKRFVPLVKRVQQDEKLRTQRKWDKECKMFLIWVMIKYFQTRNKLQVDPIPQEWEELAQILNIDKHSIQARWITLINPKQKSSNWTDPEEEIVREQMKQRQHKHIWTQIAVKLYEMNICPCARTPKQVRERWINYLNPDLRKELWLQKEDYTILSMVLKKGKRWSQIARKLEGRTENQVKNRFKSLINKITTDKEMDENEAIQQYLKKNLLSMNSEKQGTIGKRGRHKMNKKTMKKDGNSTRKSDQDMDEEEQENSIYNDQASYLSEQSSPVKKNKQDWQQSQKQQPSNQYQKPQSNMNSRYQPGAFSSRFDQQLQNQHQLNSFQGAEIEKHQQSQFKDYQRDFSNYFSQLSQQNNNVEAKLDMLNQAIDQFKISPQFNKIDMSGINLQPLGQFTPDHLHPFLNMDDNGISPFKFKLHDDLGMYNQKQSQDPTSGQIQNLMSIYQRQMSRLLGSQPPSALSLKHNQFDSKQLQAEHLPTFNQPQNFNSALLGSALFFDFSPFGPRSAKRQEDLRVEQFITTDEHIYDTGHDINLMQELQNKKNDFLQLDNPIEKYNQRRNMGQKD